MDSETRYKMVAFQGRSRSRIRASCGGALKRGGIRGMDGLKGKKETFFPFCLFLNFWLRDSLKANPRMECIWRCTSAALFGVPEQESIFFPDAAMPCKMFTVHGECRRRNCKFAHQETSLSKLLKALRQAEKTLDVCGKTQAPNPLTKLRAN